MIKGNVNLDHVTDRDLHNLSFPEYTNTALANGYWEELEVPIPDFPPGGAQVFQIFDAQCPDWVIEIRSRFTELVEYPSVTVNKLLPGRFIPPHRDLMYRARQTAKAHNYAFAEDALVRINIFLQDQHPGHFLEIECHGVHQYNKGDYVLILPRQLHSVANVSNIDRYTMQITGFAKNHDLTML